MDLRINSDGVSEVDFVRLKDLGNASLRYEEKETALINVYRLHE